MTTPLLELAELRVAHPDRGGLLGPVSLSLGTGHCHALLGRSGAGKSTLLRALAGRLPPRWRLSGRAHWQGSARGLAGGLPGTVLVTQDAQSGLDPVARIGRLLRWAAGDTPRESVDALLRAFALDPATLRRQRAADLSGGMRHRVLLAMALLRRPRLLLLDEPTSALDAAAAARVLATVKASIAARAGAALVASHDLAGVRAHCEAFHFLDAGRIADRWRGGDGAPGAASPAQAHLEVLRRLESPWD